MTTVIIRTNEVAKINQIITFAKKEKLRFQIQESDDEQLFREMQLSKKSGEGDMEKIIEFLQS